jgi:hypothetical protein
VLVVLHLVEDQEDQELLHLLQERQLHIQLEELVVRVGLLLLLMELMVVLIQVMVEVEAVVQELRFLEELEVQA